LVKRVVACTTREVPRLEAALGDERRHPRRHRPRGILVGGEDLPVDLAPAVVVVDDDVGERAPDVDPERVVWHGLRSPST
jgi:hypothetical protein